MKKAVFLSVLLFSLALVSPVHADSSEKAKVVRFDKDTYDLIVEKNNGERLLIQHNRECNSITTQFPVELIWRNGDLVELKVAVNERCEVYNYGPYTDTIDVLERIKSPTHLIADHLAEIKWRGKKYKIDYDKGCPYLRDFVGKKAYVNAMGGTLNGGILYLPKDLGQCRILSATFLEMLDTDESQEEPLQNIRYAAKDNAAEFYWDALEGEERRWVYLISRSNHAIDPADYHYRQMPLIRFSRTNSYTADRLTNGREYYFYLSARDDEGNVLPWTELKLSPVRTVFVPKNKPDFDPFEIEVAEITDDHFTLKWPDKSEDSRRYIMQFFVEGKRKIFKIISGELSEYTIERKPEWEGTRFKISLLSLPEKPFGTRYSDSHFWELKK